MSNQTTLPSNTLAHVSWDHIAFPGSDAIARKNLVDYCKSQGIENYIITAPEEINNGLVIRAIPNESRDT